MAKSPSIYDPAWKEAQKFNLAAVDRELRREGLVCERRLESLGPSECASIDAAFKEPAFEFPWLEFYLEEPGHRAVIISRMALDPGFCATILAKQLDRIPSPLGRIAGPAPADLRESKLRALFENGTFGRWRTDWRTRTDIPILPDEETSDPKLETTAFLLTRGLNRREDVERICPAFSYAEFHSYQAQIHHTVGKMMGERAKRFAEFWRDPKLRRTQKRALSAVYMENEEKLSKTAIAKRLRIPLESLRSQLHAGLKLLCTHFPEYFTRGARTSPKGVYRAEVLFRGMLRRSEMEHVHPLWRVEPGTGRRVALPLRPNSRKHFIGTRSKGYLERKRLSDLSYYESPFEGPGHTSGIASQNEEIYSGPGRLGRDTKPVKNKIFGSS